MPDVDKYFDEIDAARMRRARELSEIKFRFTSYSNPDPANINSQAVIVLTYASLEGFCNECTYAYLRFLRERGGKVRDNDWMLLIGALKPDFESLRSRNHSDDARQEFVSNLKSRLEFGSDSIDGKIVEARSNLNFARLSFNLGVLNFDLAPLQRFRIRIDRELVQWRHSVAHGYRQTLLSSTSMIMSTLPQDCSSRLLTVFRKQYYTGLTNNRHYLRYVSPIRAR